MIFLSWQNCFNKEFIYLDLDISFTNHKLNIVINIQEVMSRKIKHDPYEVTVCFKNENCLSIFAQFMPTGELFSNKIAQLSRINKETVIAALERKSEKHLRCEFQQQVEDSTKTLVISFIVNFDFLPEFKEEVRLEYVQQAQSIKKLNVTNMQAQIAEIDRAVDFLTQNGSTIHNQSNITFSGNSSKQVWKKQVKAGKYIVRISGGINNPTGLQGTDILTICCLAPGQNFKQKLQQKKAIQIRTYHMSGYHYPFFCSDMISLSNDGQLAIQMKSTVANANIYSLHIVINQVHEIK